MKEIWKVIEDSNGDYEVSNLGRVRHRDKILKSSKNKGTGYLNNGYKDKNNKYKAVGTHRLVAFAFCINQNPELYKEVNHIDGDKTNNKASNLEWVNRKLNMEHAVEHNLINRDSEKRKETCKANQLKSVELNKKKCVEYDEDGKLVEIHSSYNTDDKLTTRMYRLSHKGHYFRDYDILFEKHGCIPDTINVERIKAVNNNKPKKYTSIKGDEVKTYSAIKELPVTREQLWYCFNNEVEDKEGRMWNIEKGVGYKAYPEEVMREAIKMLKTHTYNEVAALTGINKSTLVNNNPNKRKLNRKK